MMKEQKNGDRRRETVAWGAVFITVGGFSLIPGDQTGIAMLGIGIIFLGLNLARYLSHIPVSPFTITLGMLALVLGILALLSPVLGLQFDLSLFPIFLIVIGLYLLIPTPKRSKTA